MKTVLLVCFLLGTFINNGALAQPKTNKRLEAAIESLEKTAFIKEFKKCKKQIEANVADFKATPDIDEQDIRKVKRAYGETQEAFEDIINGFKKDLISKGNRNFIAANPDRYTDFTKRSLQEANEDYLSNCQSLMDKVTGKSRSALLIAVFDILLPTIKDLVAYFQEYKKAIATDNEAYIEDKLIKKLRLKAWDSIE